MITLGVGIPAYGSRLDVGHAAMWFGLGAALASTPDKFRLGMFANYHVHGIDLCRNIIIHDAIANGCNWVLMVDADTFHDGHAADADAIGDVGIDILQMINDGQKSGAAMVGAPVHGRGIGHNGICVEKLNGDRWYDVPLDTITGTLIQVERIGGAFIAVNLEWLKSCWPAAPWFKMEHGFTGKPKVVRGEDHFFCDGIRDRGGKILCDARFVPSHVDRRKLAGEES